MRKQNLDTSVKIWLTYFFWATTLIAGFIYAWWSRHLMNSDGACYLDISDAYLQQQWSSIISPYWSPMYSVILAFLRSVLSLHTYWEFTIAHAANFFLLVCSLASFHFFITQVLKSINDEDSFRKLFIFISGYSLYVWTTLEWIGLHFITPDLGVSAVLFLSMGFVLKLFEENNPRKTALSLGCALGVGFWIKTIFFPITFLFIIFLSANFLVQKNTHKLKIILPALLIPFILLSTILIFAISTKKKTISYGESGKMTYLVDVQNKTQSAYWDTILYDPSKYSMAKNAPDLLSADPKIVYFGEDALGTYPLAYDYSYWFEGLNVKLSITDVTAAIQRNGSKLNELFHMNRQYIAVVLFILFIFHFQTFLLEFIKNSKIWLIPSIILLMYLCVRIEGRYIGSLVCLLFIGVFSSFRFKGGHKSRVLYSILLAVLVAPLLSSVFIHSYSWARSFKRSQFHRDYYIAQKLQDVWGIRSGDKVAYIGHSFEQNWARVARVQIVSEIPLSGRNAFLQATEEEKENILKKLRETPAKIVVIDNVQQYPLSKNWVSLPSTTYYVYSFDTKGL